MLFVVPARCVISETERMEIVMMLGYGDRKRSCTEVARLFNQLHPNEDAISKTTVQKLLRSFEETFKGKAKVWKTMNHYT